MQRPPRQPPTRIRVTKLQEAQLAALVRIEQAIAERHLELGLPGPAPQPRGDVDIVRFTRTHDVLVAEADHDVAGYLVWADEAPGIGWIPILMVDPDRQRFGIATKLLRELGEAAEQAGVEAVVAACAAGDRGAMAFLGVRGFAPLEAGGALPEKLVSWRDRRAAEAGGAAQPLWWARSAGLGHVPGIPRPR